MSTQVNLYKHPLAIKPNVTWLNMSLLNSNFPHVNRQWSSYLTFDLLTASNSLSRAFVWALYIYMGKYWEFIFWTSPLKTMIQLSWNLMRSCRLANQFSTSLYKHLVGLSRNFLCSNRTTFGLKWAKMVSIGNPRWLLQRPSLKSILDIFSQITRRINLNLQFSNRLACR